MQTKDPMFMNESKYSQQILVYDKMYTSTLLSDQLPGPILVTSRIPV